MKSRAYYIKLRNNYLPPKLKVVFIFESPPFSGKYFYDKTGKTSETLFSRMMEFMDFKDYENKKEGLEEFQKRGYFLVDTTYEPVNNIRDDYKRNKKVINNIPSLINDLEEIFQRAGIKQKGRVKIIIVIKPICRMLRGILKELGYKIINDDGHINQEDIPFPDPSCVREFLDKLKKLKA